MIATTPERTSPQTFKNGEIHDWYRIVLGYSDHLVADLISEFKLSPGNSVLDPFSGSGTTAVECKKFGINCWAVDANPSSCFAARVKTDWSIKCGELTNDASLVADKFKRLRDETDLLRQDGTYVYLTSAGMVKRAWISSRRLFDIIAIKKAINQVCDKPAIRRGLLLAAMHELVHTASNVRFGPELYCSKKRRTVRVIDGFLSKVSRMEEDLITAKECCGGVARIIEGDSRHLSRSALKIPRGGVDAVITSPPYPTEHDYTRNSRLELAFLEDISDRESLRAIKKNMVRSHTKGFYSTDTDAKLVNRLSRINNLAARIDDKAKMKEYGFARLYGKVTKEYFGGMRLHFRSLYPLLKHGARCAYVVGDQASYFQIKIPTASILGDIAVAEGFIVDEIRVWRKRWASSSKKYIKEHVLLLRKP